MSNPYLTAKRAEYAAIQTSIEALQTRAADEDRDLTEDEFRSVEGQAKTAKKIFAEIELLTEQANRSAQVAAMGEQVRSAAATSTATATDRDPGHYRAVEAGGQHSFFGDLLKAKIEPWGEAAQRISEHTRANQTTATVTGVVQPHYFQDLFTVMQQQDAALSRVCPVYPLRDANPFYLPGQTAVTTVGAQSSESAAITAGDAYDADYASPITPTTLVGKEIVSRQLLDGSNPAVDAVILADFARTLVQKKENLIGAAILAVGSARTGTQAHFVDPTNADFGYNMTVEAAMAVRKALFQRADYIAADYDLYQAYLELKDSSGRPLLVSAGAGPNNAIGVGDLRVDGWIGGVPLLVSNGMKGGVSTTWYGAAIHSPDVMQFAAPQLEFRYEEVVGPQQIVLGVWQYYAVAVRQGTRAVKNITSTVS